MRRSYLLSLAALAATLLAGVFGFAGTAPFTAGVARVLLVVFAVMFVFLLVDAARARRGPPQRD